MIFRQSNDRVDKILANNPFVLLGEKWKERRAEITPGLTANRVGQMLSQFRTDFRIDMLMYIHVS